jgi:anti-repressor protein
MIDALAVLSDEARQGIDARQLHAAMAVGRDFSNWVRDQVSRFDLVQGRDFEVFAGGGENPQGGRPAIDYALSINAAKLIALSQNSAAAKAARAALVKIEEQWNSPTAVMARALVMAHADIERRRHGEQDLLAEVVELRPKAEALDAIAESAGDLSLQDVGRHLGLPPNKTLWQMEEDGLLFRGSHGTLTPHAEWIGAGYFRYVVTKPDDTGRSFGQTKVTKRGLVWLAQRYAQRQAQETDRVDL